MAENTSNKKIWLSSPHMSEEGYEMQYIKEAFDTNWMSTVGANIDAVQTAQRFGIDADRAVDYIPDAKGTQLNFEAMAETVACYRMTGAVPAEPMEEIRKDMKKRGGRK